MHFLRRLRHFSTSVDVKPQPLYSYLKENASTIFAAATILGGVFAAGVYSVQTAASIKILEEKINTTEDKRKLQVMALEEKIKTTEDKGKLQVMALEEKINTTEEKIKTAKEEAKKEALERLFNIINQSEYESAKKAIQEIPILKKE